jgi:hypothetical protein
MSDVWNEIVASALKQGLQASKGAVPGAKLRQLVARIAPTYGEHYPPAGQEDEKFGEFLNRFSSLLLLLRRNGQDILVAPIDQPQLFDVAESGRTQLREDIFEAFTHIPRESPPVEPWYDRAADTIKWLPANETLDTKQFVKIVPATLSQELEDRKAFALSSGIDSEIRDSMVATLQDHSALWAFSKTVKEHGLARKWHLYRFQAVVMRIRNWCESEHIDWREDWLRAESDQPSRSKSIVSAQIDGQRHLFEKFVEGLSDEDLKRVSVPLDIVLKLLQKSTEN